MLAFIKNLEQASSSVDDVVAWKGLEDGLNTNSIYKKAVRRGVKIRYITNFPEKKEKPNVSIALRQIKKLQEIGSFEVRLITDYPSCVFAIFDRKKACICTFPSPNPIDTPALWSN